MREIIMTEQDNADILREIEMIEKKMKKMFPNTVKGHFSDGAMNIIMHTNEIAWILENALASDKSK
jgi:hypothetical protein